MAANDSYGWMRMVCNYCGTKRPHMVYISIRIAVTEDRNTDNPYPYSQTEMCRKCWDKYGIRGAMDHNIQCRDGS